MEEEYTVHVLDTKGLTLNTRECRPYTLAAAHDKANEYLTGTRMPGSSRVVIRNPQHMPVWIRHF